MTQRCEACLLWKAPAGPGPYGLCKPTPEGLPFWAVRHQADMSTQTLRLEGEDCKAFIPKGSA